MASVKKEIQKVDAQVLSTKQSNNIIDLNSQTVSNKQIIAKSGRVGKTSSTPKVTNVSFAMNKKNGGNKAELKTIVIPLKTKKSKNKKANIPAKIEKHNKTKSNEKIAKAMQVKTSAKVQNIVKSTSTQKTIATKPFIKTTLKSKEKQIQKIHNPNAKLAEAQKQHHKRHSFNSDLRYDYINASHPKVLFVSALAYILFFLPLITFKHNKFARYHANQGLLMLLFTLLCYGIAVGLYFAWAPLGIILVPIVFLCSLVYITMGICNASDGKAEPLPLFGKITIIKSI